MARQPTQKAASPRGKGQLRGVRRSSGSGSKPPKQAGAAGPAAAGGSSGTGSSAPSSNGKPNRPPTAFESRLYAVCKCIPPGRVATYGTLAEVLGSAPRACGQALRRNPFAPAVPCHRVIAASLELGGFSGSWGLGCANVQKKRALLEGEGVKFDASGRLLPSSAPCLMPAGELRSAAAAAGALQAPG